MENEQYVVEIVGAKTGIVLRRSAPRSKEAAEQVASRTELSDSFIVRVVPADAFTRLPCPKCGHPMTNVVSLDGKELVNRVCEPCNKPKEEEGTGRKAETWGT